VVPCVGKGFTGNGIDSSATVFDLKTLKHLAVFNRHASKPELTVASDKGHVYVNREDTSMVVEFDAATLKVTCTWLLVFAGGVLPFTLY
jgi:DNA-binding beta-propeller fold protein YncE